MIYTLWYGLAAFLTLIFYFLYCEFQVHLRMRKWIAEDDIAKAVEKSNRRNWGLE